RRGVAISADVLGIHQVFDFQVGQFFGLGNRVQPIASLTKHGADFRFALLERLEVVLAMIENDAGESVINAVVDEIARLPVTDGLADDASDGGSSRGHEEPARLGENLNVL